MTITTEDDLVTATVAGRTVQFSKSSMTSATGFWYSLWRTAGMPNGQLAAIPTTVGVALTRSSPGAMPIPAPAATSYLSSFEANAIEAQTLVLADRLVEFGGLAANVTTAQAVSALALPARATAELDVELWVEVFNAASSVVTTVTASYTNQSGTAGRTATLVGGILAGGWVVNRSYRLTLEDGDTGVQSVQSLTLGTASASAGNLGLVLRRSLIMGSVAVTVPGGAGFVHGWTETDLQQIGDDACLELRTLAGTSSTGLVSGNFGIAQG